MAMKVLIVPDKFKGTLTAAAAAAAIARGWRSGRPNDSLDLLPMSDGGDGFGEVTSKLLRARLQRAEAIDAAHRPCVAKWWWEPRTRTAIIESAGVIGLAMLPPKRFHPFELDTLGLGAVVQAAAQRGARRCLMGIGGSATNDGGFGLARALGWVFLDESGLRDDAAGLTDWWWGRMCRIACWACGARVEFMGHRKGCARGILRWPSVAWAGWRASLRYSSGAISRASRVPARRAG
jgi:glycerate kinase